MDSYNSSVHRTILLKPAEVTAEHTDFIRARLNPSVEYGKMKYKFSVGDVVRVQVEKSTFHRGFTPNQYTEDTYVIAKRLRTDPPTYKLKSSPNVSNDSEEIAGSYYEPQLLKVS